jgi:hypothetical protein
MMALLAIAFCCAHKAGEWKHKVIKPLKETSHGRLEQSLFRYALDYLTDHFLQGLHKTVDVLKLLMLFLLPSDMILIKKGKVKIENYST